jgi:uncharacterized membrane protein
MDWSFFIRRRFSTRIAIQWREYPDRVQVMNPTGEPPIIRAVVPARRIPYKTLAAVLLFLAVLGIGLAAAPPGLLGKADAIGYAVCHRIDERSFHIGDRQLPLCARCTGTFLGVFAGAAILAATGRFRSGLWPSKKLMILLLFPVLPWAADGLNSYLTLIPRLPHLYEPQNWLRLTTGTFLGLAVTVLFIPAVNQSLLRFPSEEPILRSGRELALYFLAAPVLIGLVLLENPVILYPLAILSTLGVLFLLTGVYTTVLLMIFRREGQLDSYRRGVPLGLLGLTLALIQIGAIDVVRFLMTGTWGGFSLGA